MEPIEILIYAIGATLSESSALGSIRCLGVPQVNSTIHHEGTAYEVIGVSYQKISDSFDRSRNEVYAPVLYVQNADPGVPD